MKRRGLFLWGFVLLMSFVFTLAISSSGFSAEKNFSVPQECMDQVRKEGNRLNIYNWAEWWPKEIFEGFSKEFGIEVVQDHFASKDEMRTKFALKPDLAYDLVHADNKDLLILRELNVLQKWNHDWIPNVNKYLPGETKRVWYDPDYQYGVATDRYFGCYLYNTKYVDPNDPRIPSWKLLFEGKEYAGRITMQDDMFFAIGAALQYLGFSLNSTKEEELAKAKDVLLRQKPLLMAYDSWPKRLILEEEVWIAQLWAGDGWFIHQDLNAITAVLPAEGTSSGICTQVLPKGAKHPATAHLFANYLFRPEVHAVLIKGIGYSPVHTVTPTLLPPAMRKWPGVVISEEYLNKCEYISADAFTGKGLKLRSEIWEDVKKER